MHRCDPHWSTIAHLQTSEGVHLCLCFSWCCQCFRSSVSDFWVSASKQPPPCLFGFVTKWWRDFPLETLLPLGPEDCSHGIHDIFLSHRVCSALGAFDVGNQDLFLHLSQDCRRSPSSCWQDGSLTFCGGGLIRVCHTFWRHPWLTYQTWKKSVFKLGYISHNNIAKWQISVNIQYISYWIDTTLLTLQCPWVHLQCPLLSNASVVPTARELYQPFCGFLLIFFVINNVILILFH